MIGRNGAFGGLRLLRGLGASAVLALSLLALVWVGPVVVPRMTNRVWNGRVAARLVQSVWYNGGPATEKIGVSQFLELAVALASAMLASFAFAALLWGLDRLRRHAFTIEIAIHGGLWLAAVLLARRISPFAATLALTLVPAVSIFLAPHAARLQAPILPSSQRRVAQLGIGSASVAVAWTLWITIGPSLGKSTFVLIAAIALLALYSALRGSEANIARNALAVVPLLPLPLMGVVRGLHPVVIAIAVVAAVVLRVALQGRTVGRLPAAFAAIALTAPVAILVIPLGLHDLASVDNGGHEGQHLAWLNSASFGRFLFADAGLFYGPVREYGLGIVARCLGGLTAENIRIAHVLFNVVGVFAFLEAASRVLMRRVAPLVVWGYLLVSLSALYFMLDYRANISLGWVDIARPGLGALVLVGSIQSFEGASVPWWRMFTWGVATGMVTLYAQDGGGAAFAGCTLSLAAYIGAALFRRGGKREWHRPMALLAWYALGFAAPLSALVAIYAAYGRLPNLLGTLRIASAVASGVVGALQYPLSLDSFSTRAKFFERFDANGYSQAECAVAPFLLCVAAAAVALRIVRVGWLPRTRVLFGVLVFGTALCRYSLSRSDFWHVRAGNIGAYFAFFAVTVDAIQLQLLIRWRNRCARVAIGPAAVAALSLTTIALVATTGGVSPRTTLIANGSETLSRGPRHEYPDIRRAGDVNIEPGALALVRYIRATTRPDQPIWVMTQFVAGGEFYFLSERHNPTRFDLWSEVVLQENVDEAFDSLKRDPPVLVIGSGYSVYGAEITNYINRNWVYVTSIGGVDVRRLRGA